MRPGTRARTGGIALALLFALALPLAGCGKRGPPKAPAAEPGDYRYPAAYPYPGTTLRSLGEVNVEGSEETDFGSNRLSPDDFNRTTTTTYGTE